MKKRAIYGTQSMGRKMQSDCYCSHMHTQQSLPLTHGNQNKLSLYETQIILHHHHHD